APSASDFHYASNHTHRSSRRTPAQTSQSDRSELPPDETGPSDRDQNSLCELRVSCHAPGSNQSFFFFAAQLADQLQQIGCDRDRCWPAARASAPQHELPAIDCFTDQAVLFRAKLCEGMIRIHNLRTNTGAQSRRSICQLSNQSKCSSASREFKNMLTIYIEDSCLLDFPAIKL